MPVALLQTNKPVTLVVGHSTRLLSSRLADGGEWRTENPDVAFVSTDGTVLPTEAGITRIIHRGDTGVDTIPINVRDPVDSVHLGADLLNVHVGRSTKLQLKAFDQGTTVPASTDLSPTWGSTSPSVATVDANGVLTANSVGCAAVIVNVDTKVDTEMVSVGPSAGADPRSGGTPNCAPDVSLRWTSTLPSSIQVGQTTQISASTAADGSGAAPTTSAPVSYTSSDVSVADVDGTGVVKGNNAGDVLLTASSNGQSISADLAVVPVPAPAVGAVGVSLSKSEVTVGDSVQATALAISPAGQPLSGLSVTWSVATASAAFVTVDGAGKVRTTAAGTAQITATIAGVSGSAQITIDAVSAAPPAGQTPAANPTGAAAVLALMGPISLAQAPAAFSWYESNFTKYSNLQWDAFGPRWDGGNSNAGYDRAAINYVWWARTGDTTYLNRAHAFAVAYRDNYLIPAGYAASPHWSQMESLYLDCQVMQDTKSCAAIPAVAERLSVFPPSDYFAAIEGEARIEARVIVALWMAEKVTGKKSALLDVAINRALSSMNESGFTPFTATCGGSLNFMNGMLYDVLTRIHDQRPGSYNAAIEKNAVAFGNYLWSTQWRGNTYPGDNSFNYMSVECPLQGSPTSAPDLNGLMLPMFGWLGKFTGDQTWFTRGDAVLSGITGADIALYKQFSESYTSSYRYFGYRSGQ